VARYTEPLLKGIGLAHYFDIVLSGDTLPEKKPHPLPLLHSAQFFGVTIDKLLLIGDSLNDAVAARAAGCPVFCVLMVIITANRWMASTWMPWSPTCPPHCN